ncbi:MAG TPA: helix-turn-helix transcriptional regulator [Kiloniellales bacterium]
MPQSPPNLVDAFAGAALRELREARGWSQQRLGRAFGVTYQAVQKVERGETPLTASRLALAAALFGVPLAHFFADGLPEAPIPSTARVLELMRHARQLEAHQLDGLNNVARHTAEANQALAKAKGGIRPGRCVTDPRPGEVSV